MQTRYIEQMITSGPLAARPKQMTKSSLLAARTQPTNDFIQPTLNLDTLSHQHQNPKSKPQKAGPWLGKSTPFTNATHFSIEKTYFKKRISRSRPK